MTSVIPPQDRCYYRDLKWDISGRLVEALSDGAPALPRCADQTSDRCPSPRGTIRYQIRKMITHRNRYPQGMRKLQGGYPALATERSFLWVFLSFRAAFLAARSGNCVQRSGAPLLLHSFFGPLSGFGGGWGGADAPPFPRRGKRFLSSMSLRSSFCSTGVNLMPVSLLHGRSAVGASLPSRGLRKAVPLSDRDQLPWPREFTCPMKPSSVRTHRMRCLTT